MSRIHLSPSVVAAIRRHAAAAYPHECCGALIGSSEDVSVEVAYVLELVNITDEGLRRRFRVSAEDYRQSEREAAERGAELIGFYHSHPDHPAEPSQYDLDHAWPNFSYVIVSVRAGAPGDLRSWRLRGDRTAFEEEAVDEKQLPASSFRLPASSSQSPVSNSR